MKSDPTKGRLTFAFKICGSKTRMLSDADDFLMVRGIYRNGLLGGGLQGMLDDVQSAERRRWLIFTKGIGFAPAVNLLRWAGSRVDVDMVIDTDKINEFAEAIKYAAIVLTTVPVLCIYPFLQKYFVKGVMVGAVKG